MRHILWILALFSSAAFAQSHEQTLSTLGLPMPPNSTFCNPQSTAAGATTCTAGPGVTIANGQISASGGGGSANPAGASFSTQYNSSGALGGTGPGTAGQCLVSNGANAAPTYQSCGAGGSVSSVTAGSTNLLNVTPTTGSVIADLASIGGYTVLANTTSSAATPTASTMQNMASAWVAVNETALTVTPGAGPTSDYNPVGFGSTVAYLHVNPASGSSVLRGLVAGSNMQTLVIDNAEAPGGADLLVLNNEDGTDATAANRFHAPGNVYLTSGARVICLYTTVLNRWQCQ